MRASPPWSPMIEDARVDALEAPSVEERGPVDVLAQELGEGESPVEDADAGEGGLTARSSARHSMGV